MKQTKKLSLLALVLMIVFVLSMVVLVACDNNENGIKLSQTELSMTEGKTGTLTATVTGTDAEVEWSVDKTDIITLTPLKKICTIKAIAEGTATITATAGDYTATCVVTVTPDDTEKVSITLNGQAVTKASVDMGSTITLVATASKGSAINWVSSNDNIATVDGGVVTGVKPGQVTIFAQVTASIKAEVVVTVNSVGGYEYYEITLKGGAADAAANPGVWAYWTEWANISAINYDNGTVNLSFSNNGSNWYNMQLFLVRSDIETSKCYKLTCDIDSTAAGHVTINGNVVELQEGKHSYTIYFTNGNGFSMQFGVEATGIDIPEATVAISNFAYTEDTERETLDVPTFNYNSNTGVITITDSNPAGSVKYYVLNLYQNDKLVTGVTVKSSGEKVDWSIVISGTYQAKIKAVGANIHYIDSAESAAQEIAVVNEDGIHYTFYNIPDSSRTEPDAGGARAKQTPGIWTYWSEGWVAINGEFSDGKLTVEFSNNTGNWYDTQLNYRHPDLVVGKMYTMQLEIDSTAGGRITLNGAEFTIQEGKHVYDIVFTENGGLSVQMTFGLNGKNKEQEIQAATMVFVIKGVEEVSQSKLVAPSFSLSGDNVIAITDTNAAGVVGYELGFFQNGELKTTVAVVNNESVDISKVPAGTYTVKLRAVAAANSLYATSDWSAVEDTITSTTQNTPIANGEEHHAYVNPGNWYEWHDQGWNGSTVNLADAYVDLDGAVHFAFDIVSGSNWYDQAAHLYYHYTDKVPGTTYTLTLKINSSVACTINVCEQSVELKEGDNNVSVTFVQPAENPDWEGKTKGATIRIYFNNSGSFVLSNISVKQAEQAVGVFSFGEEDKAAANSDNMYYWNDQNWCGSYVSVSKSTVEDGVYTFAYSGATTACWFGAQLFYKNSANVVGKQYTVSFVLVSEVAGTITVNGKQVAIVAGSNNVSVTYTETELNSQGKAAASLAIVFGTESPASIISGGTFTLSNLTFVEA